MVGYRDSWLIGDLSGEAEYAPAEWLHDLSAAAITADNVAVEGGEQNIDLQVAFHVLCLCDLGMILGEI